MSNGTMATVPPTPPREGLAFNTTNYRALTEKPLHMLPEECRMPVLGLWTMVRRLFPSCLEIATSFKVWIVHHGLQPGDVNEICRRMTEPKRIAEFRFAADVTTEMAKLVALAIDQRQQRERILAMRRETEEVAKNRANGLYPEQPRLADLLAGIGQKPQ